MSLSLAKNSIFTLVANLSLALSNWLLLVVITKYFTANTLGEVVLSLSVLSPLFLFSSFKLRTLLVVDLSNEFYVAQYFNTRLLANTLALACVPICWLFFLSDVAAMVVFLVALYKWLDAWCELSYSYLHRLQAFQTVAASQVLRSVSSIAALLLASVFFDSIVITLTCWVISVAVFSVIDVLRVAKYVRLNEEQEFSYLAIVKSFTMYCTSLTIFKKYYTVSLSLMMASLFVYIPNFVLKYHMGIEAAGNFAAVSYFLVAGSVLISSLSQAASPHLSKLVQQRAFNIYFRFAFKLCGIGFFIGAVGVAITLILGEWLLALVYNDQLATFNTELVWIMCAAMVRYSYIFLGTAMNSLKLFNYQTQISLVGTAIVLVFCILLIPELGTLGAAVAMFSATVIELVLYMIRFMSVRKQHLSQEIKNA